MTTNLNPSEDLLQVGSYDGRLRTEWNPHKVPAVMSRTGLSHVAQQAVFGLESPTFASTAYQPSPRIRSTSSSGTASDPPGYRCRNPLRDNLTLRF